MKKNRTIILVSVHFLLLILIIAILLFRDNNFGAPTEHSLSMDNMLYNQSQQFNAINNKIDSKIKENNFKIDSISNKIDASDKKIKKLQSKRHENNNSIDTLNVDGITSKFTKYLETRGSN
jgi:peptidoglycan hydrolase CwlO-like protein